MDYLIIILISFSLAADAFTLSICDGLAYKNLSRYKLFFIPLVFGFFQAAMPLLGYLLGLSFINYIKDYDHWIAFGLLLIIGTKMIYDGLRQLGQKTCDIKAMRFRYGDILAQAIATSIDALAIGLSLLTMPLSIYIDIAFIGLITFAVCLLGIFLGRKVVDLLKGRISVAEIIGGIVLILLGLKILLEHLGYISF